VSSAAILGEWSLAQKRDWKLESAGNPKPVLSMSKDHLPGGLSPREFLEPPRNSPQGEALKGDFVPLQKSGYSPFSKNVSGRVGGKKHVGLDGIFAESG